MGRGTDEWRGNCPVRCGRRLRMTMVAAAASATAAAVVEVLRGIKRFPGVVGGGVGADGDGGAKGGGGGGGVSDGGAGGGDGGGGEDGGGGVFENAPKAER
jgi:hypothetical protein